MGKLLFLGKDVVEVVGVVTGVMLGEWNQGGFLPTTVMEDRNWGSGKITRLFVRAIGWEDVAPGGAPDPLCGPGQPGRAVSGHRHAG